MSKLTKVVTDDGSITFHNADVDEHYHTTTGALEEALQKHVIPSEVIKFGTASSEVVIADVCFGLGYNSIVALTKIWEANPDCHVTLFVFENDEDILAQIHGIAFSKEYRMSMLKILQLLDRGRYEDQTLSATLFKGDFREEMQRLVNGEVDVVFFDPFSPKKQPELWTAEVFTLVYSKMIRGGSLTTYSCAKHVRENMKRAGFIVADGPSVGRKSPSTLAIK
ncbi:hypothetical protein K9M74_04160 [Candidatus Woesearchaeota archaeon]|nr:hypothetical protein [Candidatus Woesearchaeota archaeon]